jgi:hypothetical protein
MISLWILSKASGAWSRSIAASERDRGAGGPEQAGNKAGFGERLVK